MVENRSLNAGILAGLLSISDPWNSLTAGLFGRVIKRERPGYKPHQGAQECARRRRQTARAEAKQHGA